MTEHQVWPDVPHVKSRRRRCPRCRAFSHLTHSILDPRFGNTVRVYHCAECGEHLWDDGSRYLAEGVTWFGTE